MVDNVSTIEELNYVPEMPEKAKNIVIIGAGGIVSGSHLPAYKLASYPVVGIYDLNEERAKEVAKQFDIPEVASTIPELVEMCNKYGGDIPGAKGVPDEILHEASKSGVSKINVDTDLRLAMTAGIRKEFTEEPNVFDPRKYLGPARELIKETVKHKMIDVFGSSNKI